MDRRREPRYLIPLDCTWGSDHAPVAARISDLSLGGCYVDSPRVPPAGGLTSVTLSLAGVTTTLIGRVVHAQAGLGFAMRFEGLDSETEQRVRHFLSATHQN
jgi:hypothetical protein